MADRQDIAPAKERPGATPPDATEQAGKEAATATLAIAGMTCAACVRRVERGLASSSAAKVVARSLDCVLFDSVTAETFVKQKCGAAQFHARARS